MKIGYPGLNRTIGCTPGRTFRLANYSEERFIETVKENLRCLFEILKYNKENKILFFRIGSSFIPFATHEVNKFEWLNYFKEDFRKIGDFIKQENMRISMHPDHFVVLNAIKTNILEGSVKELIWHCQFLTALGLDKTAKVQIHVGGMYGDKYESIKRFILTYHSLPDIIKERLVIENDDHIFSLKDCLSIHQETGIPIIFDNLHHECINNGESLREALEIFIQTWKKEDGIPMSDYSSQSIGERTGKHTESINTELFSEFLDTAKGLDFDIMLEIKDKEKSAIEALKILSKKFQYK